MITLTGQLLNKTVGKILLDRRFLGSEVIRVLDGIDFNNAKQPIPLSYKCAYDKGSGRYISGFDYNGEGVLIGENTYPNEQDSYTYYGYRLWMLEGGRMALHLFSSALHMDSKGYVEVYATPLRKTVKIKDDGRIVH